MTFSENSDFRQLAVYNKALEIFKVSRAIACSLSDNRNILELNYSRGPKLQFAGEIVQDSMNLAPGLATIHNCNNYQLKLKKAYPVKRSIKNIISKVKKLDLYIEKDKEFLVLLNNEILQFESLLTEWLNSYQYKKE